MIHPTAIIDPGAELGKDVTVGPFAVIGPKVTIGDGTTVGSHAVIESHVRMGKGNRIHSFASVGAIPQDLKFRGEESWVEMGDGNVIREFATVNRGTSGGGGVTRIGNNTLVMAYCHIAHDCVVGSRVIMANAATLAGHITIEDGAIIGGMTGVHQFVRIGAHIITGMGTILFKDVPTYVLASGNPSAPHGINAEGLKRRGFSADSIMAIKRAYKTLYRSGLSFEEAKAAIQSQSADHPELQPLADFLATSTRGIIR